jgi:hypothetical protein
MDNRSGTLPPLTQVSLHPFLIPCVSKQTVYRSSKRVSTKILVRPIIFSSQILNSNLYSAIDSKRRVASRPSSTVSYSRNDHMTAAMYAPSPAPDQSPCISHQEAMERFGVSSGFFSLTHLLMKNLGNIEGPGGYHAPASHSISVSIATQP